MIRILFLIFILGTTKGNVLELNEIEYSRMPPLFHLDPYEQCIYEDGGIYCSAKISLVPEEPNELYSLIETYSEHIYTHYNHSNLEYGICLTKTCQNFYEQNKTEDRRLTLERCLNESFWEKYQLKTLVSDIVTFERNNVNNDFEIKDIAVLMLLLLIVSLNVIGSLRDIYVGQDAHDDSFLACFSIPRNWRRMVATAGEGSDPRLERLKCLHGIKSILILLVILCHSYIPFVLNGDNTHYIEEVFNKCYVVVIANGTLMIQIFFMLSGFLLSYHLGILREKRPVTWNVLPQAIFHRWIRLSCVYAVVLALWTTLMRYAGSGPLRETFIMNQVRDCQRDWWVQLLYINNYIDDSHCMLESWYLAADMQLYILGLLVCVLLKGRRRWMVLVLLLLIGIIAPALHTYFQDLDGYVMMTPEATRDFYLKSATFHHTYKRGHTNIAGYVIGLMFGLMVLHWQNTNYTFPRFMTNRLVSSTILPIIACVEYTGTFFYGYGKAPLWLRVVYSALIRPVFCVLVALLITSVIFKLKASYLALLEWPGWAVFGRISFCMYLIHLTVVRYMASQHTTLLRSSFSLITASALSNMVSSFLISIPMFLLIEAPFNQMLKLSQRAPDKKIK